MRPTRGPRLLPALCLVAIVAVAACDDEEQAGPRPATSSTATTLAPTTTTSAPELVDPSRGFSTDAFTVQRPPTEADEGATSLLTDARLGAAAGYDRVTLEFEALPTSLHVGFVEEPFGATDAGCDVDELPAGPKLVARFYISGTATAPPDDPASRPTYTGPDRLASTDTKSIVEARIVCEFEGSLEWVLVLREQRPFRIDVLDNPARFVIDVQSG